MTLTARIKNKDVTSELQFSTSRSSGPGGQHVNKVNSKVTLRFPVQQSPSLTEGEKEVISQKLASRITIEGELLITAQNKRTQLQNKEAVVAKFNQLMGRAFTRKKKRKPTKPTKSAVEKRLKSKKMRGEKKKMRRLR